MSYIMYKRYCVQKNALSTQDNREVFDWCLKSVQLKYQTSRTVHHRIPGKRA